MKLSEINQNALERTLLHSTINQNNLTNQQQGLVLRRLQNSSELHQRYLLKENGIAHQMSPTCQMPNILVSPNNGRKTSMLRRRRTSFAADNYHWNQQQRIDNIYANLIERPIESPRQMNNSNERRPKNKSRSPHGTSAEKRVMLTDKKCTQKLKPLKLNPKQIRFNYMQNAMPQPDP